MYFRQCGHLSTTAAASLTTSSCRPMALHILTISGLGACQNFSCKPCSKEVTCSTVSGPVRSRRDRRLRSKLGSTMSGRAMMLEASLSTPRRARSWFYSSLSGTKARSASVYSGSGGGSSASSGCGAGAGAAAGGGAGVGEGPSGGASGLGGFVVCG